jgi:hypothetical protein
VVETLTPKGQIKAGIFCVALGLSVGAMIAFYPEGLRVPAWVAFVAVSAFVFAGFSLIASALHANQVQRWLIVSLVLSMFVPGAWIAFGPGERECSVSLPFLQGVAGEVMCRGAFGVGAVIIAAIFMLLIRHSVRPKRTEA